jgi:LmbE family N-acetylglucosaminyl deacetylase
MGIRLQWAFVRPPSPHRYLRFVAETARLAREARALPLGGLPPSPRPPVALDAPRVLIFSPHPDDECVTGALALRLLREAHLRVIDVAVTQGSAPQRRGPRLEELVNACAFLGFELATTGPAGLERIGPATRAQDRAHWQAAVAVIADLLGREVPRVIFCPHEGDANSTHLGTHLLVMDALARQGRAFECLVIETEYWSTMSAPNLMIESTIEDVGDLVAALTFHAGEVRRNPYHLRLPGWMQDNVRRGGELVGGQGRPAPDFDFATLYRLRRWRGGKLEPQYNGGRIFSATDDLAGLF